MEGRCHHTNSKAKHVTKSQLTCPSQKEISPLFYQMSTTEPLEVTATESLVSLHDQFIAQLLQDNEMKERTIIHPSILYNACKNKTVPETKPDAYLLKNNLKFYCYEMEISPNIYYEFDGHTKVYDHFGKPHDFRGFLIISSDNLNHIPHLYFTRYNQDYVIRLKPRQLPHNFVLQDLILFQYYLFNQLLELYDWFEETHSNSNDLYFFPLFHENDDNQHASISMASVLKSLLSFFKPLTIRSPKLYSEERSISQRYSGLMVYNRNKHPSTFRIDRIEWSKRHETLLVHFSYVFTEVEPADMIYKEKTSLYITLHQQAIKGELKRKDYFKLKQLRNELRVMKRKSLVREEKLSISCDGYMTTGIYTDLIQHSLLLPVIFKHIMFHFSLYPLEERLGYSFRNRALLETSLTHPSYITLQESTSRSNPLLIAADHCGLLKPRFRTNIEGSPHKKPKSGLEGLSQAVNEKGEKEEEICDGPSDNERMEFLGDAVIEFLTSDHLYHMFPDYTDGQLVIYRKALICNQNLATIAKRLGLEKYMLSTKCLELSTQDGLSHAQANTLEALMGAVYLDGGLKHSREVLANLLFPEKDLYDIWMNYMPHLLKQQHPKGDRHMIKESEILQKFISLEEKVGVVFTHIRILARAFVHPSYGYTDLTMGDYQRMEFLGDAILQFLTSIHVYSTFPRHNEGHLTALRMAIVINKQLAKVSQELGFSDYIVLDNDQEKYLTEKVLADVVESFIAALYIDKGLEYAETFCEICLFPKLFDDSKGLKFLDAKSRLQHSLVYTCKKKGQEIEPPHYRVLSVEGPLHNRKCTVAVYFRSQRLAVGIGLNIQSAGMAAAENALKNDSVLIPKSLQK